MTRRLLAPALALAVCNSALASVTPKSAGGDPRVQFVDYDPDQVVDLAVAPGFALSLEFAPDERIENVVVGNSSVWQVTPNKSADHLFIKELPGAVETDLTVITDARTYNFDLRPRPMPEPTMAFIIRIRYPQTSPIDMSPRPETFYRFSGDKRLHPAEMSDDGHTTSIVWAAKDKIPAVYIIDPEGHEALVNGALRGGRYTIDDIANEFVFRLGDQEGRMSRHFKARRR